MLLPDSTYKNDLHTLGLKLNIRKHLKITHTIHHHIKHAEKKVNTYIHMALIIIIIIIIIITTILMAQGEWER